MSKPLAAIENPVTPGAAEPETAGQRPLADRQTFSAVFRRFHAPLLRYALRITSDAATAADVLQDVFLKLWEDRQTLSVQVSLQALLYTMVRNRALNRLRRTQRLAQDVAVEDVMNRDEEPRSDATLEASDLQRHLYRWIDDLPPRRAEAFTLSRYHGLKHREIAALMGVSERTVDTHILLALRELRRRLDDLNAPARSAQRG